MEIVKINDKSYSFFEEVDPNHRWYEPTLVQDCIEVGKASLCLYKMDIPELDCPSFSLDNIYVKPGHRGNKLGSFLLDNVIDFARKEESAIKICIAPHGGLDLAQLTNFYLRHGFYLTGENALWLPK
jgi:GNAT superfamily N-acetyltransferase